MLNLVIIMGRLTRDPELRQTPNNVNTATISVAVDRDYKKDGQEKETDFFDVVAWRGTADFICNNFVKGQMIALYGRLQKRNYEDSSGNKRTVTEVIADSVYFCGPKSQGNEAPAENGLGTDPFFSGQNNSFVPDFSVFPSAFGQQQSQQFQQPAQFQQQPPQFQQQPSQNMQQPIYNTQQPVMGMPQAGQPNIQPAPTMQGSFTQMPVTQTQQTAAPPVAVGNGIPFNPNEWEDL